MKIDASSFVVDGSELAQAKARARDADPEARNDNLREVAQQFESLFTHMLLKNMRSASLGEGAMDSEQSRFYQDMFDQQMSSELSSGRGLGIADLLVRQLGGESPVAPAGAARAYRYSGPTMATDTSAIGLKTEATSGESAIKAFIQRLAPHALKAARQLKVAPQFLLAQAALETGWGKHVIQGPDGLSSNNLFGVKATGSWEGGRVNATTREYEGERALTTRAEFRAYPSEADSFEDYTRLLLGSSRYRGALNQGDNGEAFARALQRGGYATDPTYADKILSIAGSATMRGALDALKIP